MIRRSFYNEDALLWEALVLSVFAHFLLFHVGAVSFRFHEKRTIEIDITNMGHLAMPYRTASSTAHAAKSAAPAKEWLKPAPNQKTVPAPIPTQPVAPTPEEPPAPPAPGPTNGEYGIGAGETNIISRIPQLRNLRDLNAILRRYYPEAERTAGHQGMVVCDLHIDMEGNVSAVDVVRSAGPAFDDAARNVAKLLHFTPAFLGAHRVPVKMRQAIQFKLEE
jgi:TonB family protein